MESNLVKLIGNLGKDPVPFETTEQVEGLFCSLAVNNSGKADTPTWVKCFAYANVAAGMKALALKKGHRLQLHGELRQDKDDILFVKVVGGKRIGS